jgi:glycerophosphoryl diester phosphodiesterase
MSDLPKAASRYEFGETTEEKTWFKKAANLPAIGTFAGVMLLWLTCFLLIGAVFFIAYFTAHGHITLTILPPVLVGLWAVCMFFAVLESYLNVALFAINFTTSIIYASVLTAIALALVVAAILGVSLVPTYSYFIVQTFPMILTFMLLAFWVVESDESRPRDSRSVEKRHPFRSLITQHVHNCFIFTLAVYGVALVLLGFYQSIAVPLCVFALATSFELMDSPVTNRFRLSERELLAGLEGSDDEEEEPHQGLLNPGDVEQAFFKEARSYSPNASEISIDLSQRRRTRYQPLSKETVEDRRRSVQLEQRSHYAAAHTLHSAYEHMVVEGTLSNKSLKWALILVITVIVCCFSLALSHAIPLFIITQNTPLRRGDVTVVGHRGMGNRDDTPKGVPPENSMAAFRKALALGANRVELDVQMTKDGQLVVIHDYTVDRTTNGTGNVIDLTLAQIKSLTIKSDNPIYANETVPTYEEVISLLQSSENTRNVNLTTEIKFAYRYKGKGLEQKVYQVVRENNFLDRVQFLSLDGTPLNEIRRLDSNATLIRLYLYGQQSMSPVIPYDANIVGTVAENIVLNPWFVLKAHNHGRKVYVWFEKGMENPEYVSFIAHLGVDHLCVYEVGNVIKQLQNKQ